MGPVVLASQLAAGISVLAGAALVKSVMEDSFWKGPMFGGGSGIGGANGIPRCATCNGSGRMECFCNRWSDGDAGCRTCAGSGRMACRSCGGTGTGRPMPVRLTVQQPRKPPTS